VQEIRKNSMSIKLHFRIFDIAKFSENMLCCISCKRVTDFDFVQPLPGDTFWAPGDGVLGWRTQF
jgi:hypothetical protein